MKYPHCFIGNTSSSGPFSIAMLVYQRVPRFMLAKDTRRMVTVFCFCTLRLIIGRKSSEKNTWDASTTSSWSSWDISVQNLVVKWRIYRIAKASRGWCLFRWSSVLKKHLDCLVKMRKVTCYICLHYGNSHGIHLFLFESRHEHHPAVSFERHILFPWAEWDCCVQVALYLVSALHKLQLVLISEKHHFREENDLRKLCYMFCFLFDVMLILAKAFHPWALNPMMLRCLSLETCYILGIWEVGVSFKVAMVGWNSAGLKTMEIIKVRKIEEGLKWQPFISVLPIVILQKMKQIATDSMVSSHLDLGICFPFHQHVFVNGVLQLPATPRYMCHLYDLFGHVFLMAKGFLSEKFSALRNSDWFDTHVLVSVGSSWQRLM